MHDKSHVLPEDIRWHFIGHLQTNKVKRLLETKGLWMVETVDSKRLANELNKVLGKMDHAPKPLKILVQVKTSDEDTKSGVPVEECVDLVRTIREEMKNLEFKGLMTIGKLEGDPVEDFQKLYNVRQKLYDELELSDLELSMGMSGDYEIAVCQIHGSFKQISYVL